MKTKTTTTTMTTTKAAASYGRPQASKQSSRKGRKAWRKNTDLGDVEASLETQRVNERAGLGSAPLSHLEDASLFIEDRAGDAAAGASYARRGASRKPLKSLEILSMRSKVPAVTSRVGAGKGKVNTTSITSQAERTSKLAGLPKKTQDRLRRLAGKTVKGPFGGILESEQGSALKESAPVQAAVFDAWKEEQQAKTGAKGKGKRVATEQDDDWAVNDPRHKKPKLPRTIAIGTASDPVLIARTLSALPVPDAGQSYNPTIESHEALLQRAYELALERENDEERAAALKKEFEVRRRRLNEEDDALFDEHAEGAPRTILGMRVDEPLDDDDEEDVAMPSKSVDDDDDEEVKKDPKRKTKAQRARAQRHKDEVARAAARRTARQERALLSTLPAIRKSLRQSEVLRAEAAQQRAAARIERLRTRGLVGERARVGKYRVPDRAGTDAHEDVQLAEELAEGLRAVKPQGNHFRDRFLRLQARGLTEARTRVVPSKPKRGTKAYERHSYKRFV